MSDSVSDSAVAPPVDGDLSFRTWCQRQTGRRDKVGNYARFYLASPGGDPPFGYSEARAEYDLWWKERVDRPEVRSVAERLRIEAARPRAHVEPEIVADIPFEHVLAGALTELRELVGELLESAAISEGRRDRLRRTTFKRLDDRLAQLRRLATGR